LPSISDTESIGTQAKHNAEMLRQITGLIGQCVSTFENQDYSIFADCAALTENFETHLTSVLSESGTNVKSIAASLGVFPY
jgi:hypothetical protein